MNSLFPGKTSWNNGYSRIDDCKSGKVARGLGLRPARQQIQCFAADELADGFQIAQGKKNAARRRLRELGREWILISMARIMSCPPQVSDDLQQRLAAFAVIGQDHESMPVTAAVDNFVCEQEVPLVQPVRHIQRI